MDNYYPAPREVGLFDEEAESTVDSWTIDELRFCADLESVQAARTAVDDWRT